MTDAPPFSRRIVAADIPAGGREMRVEASPAELAALAESFRLPAVGRLEGAFVVIPKQGGLRVEGKVEAEVTQVSVVSLEPFDTRIREEVALEFTDRPEPAGGELDLSPDAPDPPEALDDGAVDLGAVAAEFLALALDPYPRKPGEGFDGHREQDRASPFAKLGDLLGRDRDER